MNSLENSSLINVKCLISYIVCTTIILYSSPNWYALVKSCINVNHYVLLVRRCVWFTEFTKF